MSGGREPLLSRWSRLKRASGERARQAPAAAQQPARPLPALDSLEFDSDFAAFMQGKVAETVKRAALRKLFSDPRFNVMDGLDTYIDDYSIEDPIPAAMLGQLEHARTTLFGPPAADEAAEPSPDPQPASHDDADAAA